MSNILESWYERTATILRHHGMVVTFKRGERNENCSVDVDGDKFVGTICYWPEASMEFQFNDCNSGDVLVLESKNITDASDLDAYLKDLLFTRLRAKG